MDPVLWLRMSGDFLWIVIGSDSGTARSVSSRERSSKLPGSGCFCPFWMRREKNKQTKKEIIHMLISANKNWAEMLGCDSTCRATSAEAGLKPKPVGAFSSSSTPLTPGLKWSSTWKRSSEEMSFKKNNTDVQRYGFEVFSSWMIHSDILQLTLRNNPRSCQQPEVYKCPDRQTDATWMIHRLYLNYKNK